MSSPVTAANPPRILVFSEGVISTTHGTGAIFLRNFARYPADRLANAFIGSGEQSGIARSIDLNAVRWPQTVRQQLAALPIRLANRIGAGGHRPLPVDRRAVGRALGAGAFPPELIYAICWSAEGLAMLDAVVANYPGVPLLVHFHDFWPSASASFEPLLQRLAPRITAVWAVSPSIVRFVEQCTGLHCSFEPQFHIELPAVQKQEHRLFDATFRAIVFGNFWSNELLSDVKAVWQFCRERLPSLGPIAWYCHPDSVAKIRAAGTAPEPEVQPMGFVRGDAIWSMLAEADLALVPFSRGAEPASDYERYSMPSRLTELAAAGLPVFGLTGQSTPLAEYLTEKDIGPFAPASDTAAAGQALHDLILDPVRRADLGRRARTLAEKEYPLDRFQDELYARLAALARSGVKA